MSSSTTDTFASVLADVLTFRDARDWRQFHTPRQLAAALAIEAAELQETMLWKTDEQVMSGLEDPARRERIAQEVADVLIYALLFTAATGIDPVTAIRRKLVANSTKYPVETSRGSALKYNEFPEKPLGTG